MRVDGYIRVSRVGGREGDTFISPAEQRRVIESWCAAHGHELQSIFEDLDEPGSKLERDGLVSAMTRVEEGQSSGIVVAKLDRFTRSTAHLGPLLERLRSAGGVLVSVNEGIDTSTSTGKLVADIMGAISEWELARIRDNWTAARKAAVERGIHITGTVPLGYLKGTGGVLEVDPATEGLVRDLFRRRASGESWKRLASWLSGALGGKRTYTVGAVRNIIGNRVYLGEARAGSAIVKQAAHPPLVDRAEFEAANRSKGVVPERSGRAAGLLSGILRCAGCRYAMKLARRSDGRGEYRCKCLRRENAGVCEAPATVGAHLIEPLVLERFWKFVGDYNISFGEDTAGLDEARQAVLIASAELDAVLDRRLSDALGGDDSSAYIDLVKSRREALDAAQAELSRLEAIRRGPMEPLDFDVLWPDLSLYEQRLLLASVFDCVFVRRTSAGGAGGKFPVAERTFFCFLGEGPELPTKGRRWEPTPFHFDVAAAAADGDSS